MLDNTDLHRLADLNTSPHPTLSLYLGLDAPREARLLALSNLLKTKEQQMGGNGHKAQWEGLAGDCEQITRFVAELSASPGRGLALFSCAKQGVFEPHTLAVPVDNLLEVGPYPYIRPLAALAGDLCRTLTILVDRQQARFFTSFMGQAVELEDQEVLNQAEPAGRVGGQQGRAGDTHLSRKADEALNRHYKEVAAKARSLVSGSQCSQVLLGGAKGSVDALAEQLHPYLKENLAGTFQLDVNASLSQVGEALGQVQTTARRQRQEGLLANLADNLGPGGQAATGLNQVLGALFEGRVHTLFVRRGLTSPGGLCASCGRLRHVSGPCPICGQEMLPVDDVVNPAIATALKNGARLEQIEGESSLDKMGGVAALLRYA